VEQALSGAQSPLALAKTAALPERLALEGPGH
jgi:hypothetical protein